jgi:hypothetical protein
VTRNCGTCNGTGRIGYDRIGPEEFRTVVDCGDCDGSGQEPVECELCGDHEATREAWVVDSENPRKASLLLLCEGCHDHDDVALAMPPTRSLPSREQDTDLDHKQIAAGIEALRGHATVTSN